MSRYPGDISHYGRVLYLLISVQHENHPRSYIEIDFVNKAIQFFAW